MILTCLLLFGSAGILKVWTGLIVSPFRSRIRIRLQDGYMEQEHGSNLPGEDPDPWPCPHNPIKVETFYRNIQTLNWPSNSRKKISFHTGRLPDENYFSFFKLTWSKLGVIQEEGWEVQDGSTHIRRVVKLNINTLTEGGETRRLQEDVTLCMSFFS